MGISHLFPCILTHNSLAFKFTFYEKQIYKCLFGNIKYDATISKIERCKHVHSKYSEFGGYLLLSFFVSSYTDVLSQNDSSKLHSVFKIPLFGATTKVSLSFIGNEFCSVSQSSQTRVLHEVAFLVFCGILVSFLA